MSAQELEPRPIDVRGTYGRVTVKTPDDLVRGNIYVSPEAVAATWGAEAATDYHQKMLARTNPNGHQPKASAQSDVIFDVTQK